MVMYASGYLTMYLSQVAEKHGDWGVRNSVQKPVDKLGYVHSFFAFRRQLGGGSSSLRKIHGSHCSLPVMQ
jgi:hypothetical protein